MAGTQPRSDASTAPCAMSRCLKLPQTKWIGEIARVAAKQCKGARGTWGAQESGAIGRRHCGSNNSRGTEPMEPAIIIAPLMPFPPLADWAWAASEVDLEEELLPGYGARQKRIPQAARGDLG